EPCQACPVADQGRRRGGGNRRPLRRHDRGAPADPCRRAPLAEPIRDGRVEPRLFREGRRDLARRVCGLGRMAGRDDALRPQPAFARRFGERHAGGVGQGREAGPTAGEGECATPHPGQGRL
ncbi:MAG: hypothetical protein AVDCRST_MAG90-1020, partial [uncultured Microvirga sp.]